MDDLISRQAAIDAILEQTVCATKRELVERCDTNISDENGWLGGVCIALDTIEDLPSAQPDLSEYSDKLWRNAYERGRKDAVEEIIHCRECKYHIDGFFCQKANHHTSDKECCASVFGAERKKE